MLSRRHFLLSTGAVPVLAPAFQGALQSDDITEIPLDPPRPSSELPAPLSGAQWKVSYFHDFADSSLVFSDFVSPSPDFALAAGVIDGNRRGKPKELGLVSRDGGANWNEIKLPGAPALLFALDAAHVWLVSAGRLYFSADQGRKWSSLRLPKYMARVCFTSPLNGFAYGRGKTFYRTTDGGRRWSPVPESQQLNLTDLFTFLRTMQFHDGRIGILAGNSRLPQFDPDDRPDLPAWTTPERALARRPRPATFAMLYTTDGGATWKPSVTSAFGTVLRMKVQADLSAALFDYGEGFVCPSEVYLSDYKTGRNQSLFRRKALRVTDFLFHGAQGYLLSVIEPFGTLPGAGLPGRLRILYSPDGNQWFQTPVDYRAQGQGAFLGAAGDRCFAVLVNGMILRLAS
jgi:hypothetical protein